MRSDLDLSGRKRAAPWKKPRRVRKPKIDRKAQRQVEAAICALMNEIRTAWLEHWNEPKKYKSAAHARRCAAWHTHYKQADGNWPWAAKAFVDRACMMSPKRLAKIVTFADALMFHPDLYFAHEFGQVLDWGKVAPAPTLQLGKYAPGLGRLLKTQRRALVEAGYVPPAAPKPAPAKTAIIPFKKDKNE